MTEYQIKLATHLDLPWQEWFEATSLTHQPEGTTCLNVTLPDQSALIGLLLRIHNLGLEIISLSRQGKKEGSFLGNLPKNHPHIA